MIFRPMHLMPTILILASAAATLFMTGLIWFVQCVHYPLLASVARADFPAYHRRHTAWTTWIVAPPMILEAISAALLPWFRPAGVMPWQPWAALALVIVIWLSTALLQMPCHGVLAKGFDVAVHHRLVRGNWLRTVAWSLRSALVLWMLVRCL